MNTKIELYECPKCRIPARLSSDLFYYDDDSMEHRCEDCDTKINHFGQRDAEYVSIAVYSIDRAYGGPEEGGWYYDQGYRITETLRNFSSDHFDDAAEYAAQLVEEWESSPSSYSVRVYQEKLAPAVTPELRPRYS